MEGAARQVAAWCWAQDRPVGVRIPAGTRTAFDLAERVAEYWAANDAWSPEFMFCDRDLDIARREVDIGVRNRRPEQPWVAPRQIGWVDSAVHASGTEVTGWIGPSWQADVTPSMCWVTGQDGAAIMARAGCDCGLPGNARLTDTRKAQLVRPRRSTLRDRSAPWLNRPCRGRNALRHALRRHAASACRHGLPGRVGVHCRW